MPAPVWKPSTTYVPGAFARPTSAGTATPPKTGQPDNADFESGSTDWTLGSDTAIATDKVFSGTNALKFTGTTTGDVSVQTISTDQRVVVPGQSVSASCYGNTGSNSGGASVMAVLFWYNAAGANIGQSAGTPVVVSHGAWKASPVTASAPPNAVKVAIGVGFIREAGSSDGVWADKCSWNYAPILTPSGLEYKAVQPAPGKSAGTEPVWPTSLGETVVDGGVTWEAVQGTLIEWTASPLNISGDTEPDWPTEPGALVNDNGITWKTTSPVITDPNCPHSKIVTVAANKVFAGDKDITKFCATNDATDWSSEQDAGYIPTGLWAIGETDCSALAVYRANLAVWTSSSLQVWQVDPDPANMAFIDAVIGGTDYLRAASPMANDLYYLSALGVRSVGITATTGTIGGTDVGSPIDPPIQAALKAYNDAIALGERPVWDPLSIVYPNASQDWFFFGNEAYVYALSVVSKISAWQHYTFPFYVTDAAVLDGELYVRSSDNDLYVLDESLFQDDGTSYDVQAQMPWLDFGAPGVNKMLIGVDAVIQQGEAGNNTFVSVGWDENNPDSLTPEVAISKDTLPGTIIPIPTTGAALSIKLRNASPDSWECSAVTAYYNLLRTTS